jgi:hypothetical protein
MIRQAAVLALCSLSLGGCGLYAEVIYCSNAHVTYVPVDRDNSRKSEDLAECRRAVESGQKFVHPDAKCWWPPEASCMAARGYSVRDDLP